ncbi:G-type lectin S-receptor-like serine threonine-kinase At1g11410 [Olea europaea subsp. europaea]|uniref:G-type lectin S-receptor-like serine threonine-kinase At1g11410 n=1 Tax=Olea europaea subsp. europaea TaxID=158383 RepID=A0A8S0PSG0_OLEEU|nr:G-type lectin S-receptor-like serine threonine-kinase At1g11410 [Olea europaea subsp. europaea]
METGNFVLFQDQSKSVIAWQSFDYPTNIILRNMKAGWRRTRLNTIITSWKSRDDLGTGSERLWRTRHWNGLRGSGVPVMDPNYTINISYIENDDEVTITYVVKDPSIFSILVLNEMGTLEQLTWQGPERGWARFWSAHTDQCDNSAHCGAYGDLFNLSEFECSCLPGYEPQLER